MSLSRWLSRFRARLQSQKRPRRRPTQTLSVLYEWELENRCLLSGGVPAPMPSGGWVALSKIMWDGANTPLTPGGITFPTNVTVPAKSVTFTNTTDQTIYPFLRDANSGIGAGSNSGLASGAYYDPQDPHNQEFRLYIGYVQNGQDYLGLPRYSSITVRVPLVFWNAENTYIATDGTNLIPTQPGQLNPFTYDASSVRGISPIQNNNAATPGYWVTSFTSPSSTGATGGFVMLYNATTASTPALPAPAQLAEFTIRDPFLSKLGLTSKADTQVLIDYDVSYVDNAIAPITMEASAVPVQIPSNSYPNQSPNPPAPSFGWTGSTLTLTAMQSDIQNFVNNTTGTTAYLGQYFTNPNSPPPSPSPSAPPGWPAYLIPPAGGGVTGSTAGGGVTGSTKIPGGQNIFLQSPLNNTTSSLNPAYYMLTSGGTTPIQISPGGDPLATGRPTQLPLTLSPAQRNALANQLESMLQTGNLNLALSTNPNTTLGEVTGYNPDGKLLGFAIVNGGQSYTSNLKYQLTGGGQPSATGTASVKSGHISLVKLPNTGGGGIYTSAPSLTFTSGGGGGSGAQVYPDIGGGTATVTLNGGVTLPTGKGLTYIFSRPVTDYAATDITNLWYTWAQYYINYFKDLNFQPEPVYGTLTLQGDAADQNEAAYIAVKNSDLNGLPTPLAVGMMVSGNGISPAAGTNVTIVKIQPDSTEGYTDFYLSQLQGGSNSGTYTFGPPQALPYSDPTGLESITVTNGGTGYVPPLTVTLNGGNGAGATAVVNGITNGAITGIKITNPGGNYTVAPTVAITGGGGAGATATAVITNGQVTGITINQGGGGSGYSMGTTVAIDGSGTGATASAVVNPNTGAVTSIVITNSGTGYNLTMPTVTINANNQTGNSATATATVGSYVSTYANLLPSPTTMLQGGTVLQFAGSVYEALEAEASIPPTQSLRFYNSVMPPPVGLVGTTIGSDLGDLPNSNGGASVLGGQVRDLIKSILRGVYDFNAVPESTPGNPWYPNPSMTPISTLPFDPFNLDPYVWFIHDVLGMSGYGFSTDDDIANVGAFTSPYATDPSKTILPNNLVITFGGGTSTLPQPQQWFPGVPWGTVKTTGTVTTSGGKAYVTLTAGQVPQYYEVIPVTPGQSGAANVSSTTPGLLPMGTTVNIRNLESNLSFLLNVPKGQTVTPSGGTVSLTFSGPPMLTSTPPPTPTPTPTPPTPTSTLTPTPTLTPTQTINDLFDLVQDEIFLTIDQIAAFVEQTLTIPQTPARLVSILADTNLINANPLASTPLGQLVLFVTRIETLVFLLETPIPFSPDEVL